MEQAFPASVMALENGHRPVFPGLVRVAELHLLDAGRSLPNWLQAIFHPIARRYRAYAGDIRVQHGPATALGLLALATLLWATFTTWRDRTIQTRLRLAGLALAWFGVGVAGIVVLGRLDYFHDHPDQVFANRHLPGSCLLWLGGFRVLLGSPRVLHRSLTAAVAVATASTPAMGVATSEGYRIWGELVRDGLRVDSAGIAVGHLESGRSRYGEGYVEHIEAALPVVRAAGISMFSWPETRLLGQPVTGTREASSMVDVQLAVTRFVANRLDPVPTLYLEVTVRADTTSPPERLLVLDDGQLAVGVLVRVGSEAQGRYRGYARGGHEPRGLVLSDTSGRIRHPLALPDLSSAVGTR